MVRTLRSRVKIDPVTVEPVKMGDALYIATDDGKVGLAQGDVGVGKYPCIGLAATSAASGTNVEVVVGGLFSSPAYDFSGYVGKLAYLDPSTAGGVTPVEPSLSGQVKQRLGFIVNYSTLLVHIEPECEELT